MINLKKIILFLYKCMVLFSILFIGVIIYIYLEGKEPNSSLYYTASFVISTILLKFILKYLKWK